MSLSHLLQIQHDNLFSTKNTTYLYSGERERACVCVCVYKFKKPHAYCSDTLQTFVSSQEELSNRVTF